MITENDGRKENRGTNERERDSDTYDSGYHNRLTHWFGGVVLMSLFDRVMIFLGINTDEVDASIEATQAKADATVAFWRRSRQEILSGIRNTMTMLSTMMSSFRVAMSIIGAQIDPFFSALIGMTLSTVSMMLSLSAALAVTGVGFSAAMLLASIAVGLNIALMGKLINDKTLILKMFKESFQETNVAFASGLTGVF